MRNEFMEQENVKVFPKFPSQRKESARMDVTKRNETDAGNHV
jgi:hypothetical protein